VDKSASRSKLPLRCLVTCTLRSVIMLVLGTQTT